MGVPVIPDFVAGPDGYAVLPPGRWTCTLDEFKARFVHGLPDAPRRKQIIEDLEEYQRQQQACGLVVTSYWIDGSFTSAKLNPGDIDVTAIIDGPASNPTGNANHWVSPGSQWKVIPHPDVGRTLLVDGFGIVKVPDGHPDMDNYRKMRGYWDDWWQRCRGTGEAESKGYVEVRT